MTLPIVCFDCSNIFYVSAHRVDTDIDAPDYNQTLIAQVEQHIEHLLMRFGPVDHYFACDDSQYWRREVFPEYKANRPMTPKKQAIRNAIEHFKIKHADRCLQWPRCEADDMIFSMTSFLERPMTIVSTDQDFMQLQNQQIRILDPISKRFRQREPDTTLALFIKCMRGDKVDNIPSAYPRVSQQRLKKCYEDPLELKRLLATDLPTGNVGEQYRKNRDLIDMSHIPSELLLEMRGHLAGVFSELRVCAQISENE